MGIGGFLVLSLLALGPPGSLGNPTREMQLLSAMEKVLDALGSRIDEMYTDSAFGLRFADDQLHVLLEHLEAGGPPTPPVALDAIRAVQVKAHRYARAAAVVVDTSSSTLAAGILREGLWRAVNPGPPGAEAPSPANGTLDSQGLNESVSDRCLGQLFSGEGCRDVSGPCWRTMTGGGQRGYGLTHQVLFVTIGMALNCSVKMESLAGQFRQPGPRILLESLCRRVVQEAETVAEAGFPARLRDLFLEQVAVCGSLGYPGFDRDSWIGNALSWQRSDGCFTFRPAAHKTTASSRNKREARTTRDGCDLHMTSVGAGALAVFLKARLLATQEPK
ncbi:UPF0764 protein C16orf89 homolog isoform X2 [Ixodes scapularis]|uniref:UPF0764 protein C16orf89 homolog isoform X2 n=1 Tax=Ixodes scapularis TaxID=6945 RepID=UPI001A9E0E45|nr:UPF0764 protein C16orf89 homolog isoform X2 [Ixodes scapularis]